MSSAFSLYPHGYGSIELLSGNDVQWDGGMTGKWKDCNNCSLRDICNGICQFAAPWDREGAD